MKTPGGPPLDGLTVLVTRPRDRALSLVEGLEATGAEVVIAPTIQQEPPEDPGPLTDAAAELATYDWVVFTSAAAVRALHDAGADPETAPPCAAVGPVTGDTLAQLGYAVACRPPSASAAGLAAALAEQTDLAGCRVLLPRADIGLTDTAEALRAAGAQVTEVIAYRTVPCPLPADVAQQLAEGQIDVVTFASPSAVRGLLEGLPGKALAALMGRAVCAAIGPRTAGEIREAGLALGAVAEPHTTDGLIKSLIAWAGTR